MPIDYAKSDSKLCQSTQLSLNTITNHGISQAKSVCTKDERCAMIADVASLGERFALCDWYFDVIHSFTASTLYIKCKYINKLL